MSDDEDLTAEGLLNTECADLKYFMLVNSVQDRGWRRTPVPTLISLFLEIFLVMDLDCYSRLRTFPPVPDIVRKTPTVAASSSVQGKSSVFRIQSANQQMQCGRIRSSA